MITGAPSAMTVRARQKLQTPAAASKFNENLISTIQGHIDKGATPSFDDFDISQNKMPLDQFEAMFATFQTTGVQIQRMRMFGCASFDDNAAFMMADWLRSVTAETAPYEMHLSDCAITVEGFNALMDAIESNDAFPTRDRFGKLCPMYMRLENNYIQPEDAIKDKVNQGVIAIYKKNSGPIRGPVASAPEAKIKILCQREGQFQQRTGMPPAPENAPPPKPVFDRNSEQQNPQQQGKGGGGYWEPPQWSQAASWATAAWQALPGYGYGAPQAWPQQQAQVPFKTPGAYGAVQARPAPGASYAAAVRPQVVQPRPQVVAPSYTVGGQAAQGRTQAFNAFGGQQNAKGAAGGQQNAKGVVAQNMQRAADRSRTPQPKVATKPKPASKGLPAGWEEHFSDEYQIPYYWHNATGESSWERPGA